MRARKPRAALFAVLAVVVATGVAETTGTGRAAARRTARSAPVPPAVQRAMQYIETGELPPEDDHELDPADPNGLLVETGRMAGAATVWLDAAAVKRYRIRSAFERARSLASAYESAASTVERQDRNVRNGAVALYVLGRAARDPGYLGNLSDRQLAYMRSVVRRDARSLSRNAETVEPLRTALAEATGMAERIAKEGGVPVRIESPGVTVAVVDAQDEVASQILAERAISRELAMLLDDLAVQGREWESRTAHRDLGPAPPAREADISSYVPEDTPLPRETFVARRKADDTVATAPLRRAVELSATPGAEVLCAADGRVGYVGEVRGMGPVVIVEHPGGLFSVYARLGATSVQSGAEVSAGDPIGAAGPVPWGDGFGVHFEVRAGEEPVEAARLLGSRTPVSAVLGQ